MKEWISEKGRRREKNEIKGEIEYIRRERRE